MKYSWQIQRTKWAIQVGWVGQFTSPVRSGGVWLCQTRPIPRSPDSDNNDDGHDGDNGDDDGDDCDDGDDGDDGDEPAHPRLGGTGQPLNAVDARHACQAFLPAQQKQFDI